MPVTRLDRRIERHGVWPWVAFRLGGFAQRDKLAKDLGSTLLTLFLRPGANRELLIRICAGPKPYRSNQRSILLSFIALPTSDFACWTSRIAAWRQPSAA